MAEYEKQDRAIGNPSLDTGKVEDIRASEPPRSNNNTSNENDVNNKTIGATPAEAAAAPETALTSTTAVSVNVLAASPIHPQVVDDDIEQPSTPDAIPAPADFLGRVLRTPSFFPSSIGGTQPEPEEHDEYRKRAFSFTPEAPANAPVVLVWKDLTVRTRTQPPKTLLHNISGSVTGGFWAIMGASGGGKTTLLSTVSLRLDQSKMEVTGTAPPLPLPVPSYKLPPLPTMLYLPPPPPRSPAPSTSTDTATTRACSRPCRRTCSKTTCCTQS